jgi:cytochrome c oxidase subunit 2
MSRAAARCRVFSAVAVLSVGCASDTGQSTLHPAGPAAAEIAWLWWIMCAAFTAVFVLVVVLLGIALRHRGDRAANESDTPPLGRTGFIVAGGVVLPVVVLTPLYLFSLRTSASLAAPRDALTVRVVGHMWWWEVRYPGHDVVVANELHIPAGQPVRLELTSADVIHSFWVPRLHGKRDLIPGIENRFWIQADEPGVYRGQCGEYCGTQHANMAFLVVALPSEEFRSWLAERGTPRPQPIEPAVRQGMQVFLKAGCAQCHAVRGIEARSNIGPDLTHIGSRRTLGAALLPNTRGNLAGWVADPQAIKPGVKMPRSYLPADDLLALITYLESLQ